MHRNKSCKGRLWTPHWRRQNLLSVNLLLKDQLLILSRLICHTFSCHAVHLQRLLSHHRRQQSNIEAQMRKPCYQFEEDLLVLAQVARSKSDSWHLCKAHISRGESSSTTKVSREFVNRTGWFASECKKASGQPISHDQGAGGRASQQPKQFSCSIAVGACQIETIVEIAESAALLKSSAPFDKVEWHIHIGEEDFRALKRSGWDSQICYLDVVPQGPSSRHPKCPSGCTSFTDALSSGHADCMRYWHGRPVASLSRSYSEDEAVWDPLYGMASPNCDQAAQWPSAEVLMYAHDILRLPWDADTCVVAAEAGSIDCLSYAHCSGCPWHADVCSIAVEAGSMACLMYAHAHGCEWDRRTCVAAAKQGSLACLVYAHEHGCEWDKDTCAAAARQGSMACLKYAHEHGCKWNTETCAAAAEHKHLDCLMYAHTHGCEWDELTCRKAASNLEILAYAFENGCPWDASTCVRAARAGSIECLVYAHERGCPWSSFFCEPAKEDGGSQCGHSAHKRGCRWIHNTLHAAAERGDLDCLVYAHKHGCPYASAAQWCNSGLTLAAVRGGSLPCLKYVRERMGCSWQAQGIEWKDAFWKGRYDVLEYIHKHGGAWCKQEEVSKMVEDSSYLYKTPDGLLDGKARCLLYMHCCGGCEPLFRINTKVRDRVLELMQERRAAVLLSFQAACHARGGGRAADAAHAAMAKMPDDLIRQITWFAKLLTAEEGCC